MDYDMWSEYDSAASWCARRQISGRLGSRLPEGLSGAVRDAINEDPEAFERRVREFAYASAMSRTNARSPTQVGRRASKCDRCGHSWDAHDEHGCTAGAPQQPRYARPTRADGLPIRAEDEDGDHRRNATSTPWGPSQSATRVAPGIMRYDTAGHGGYHLSSRRQAEVHPALCRDDGWYEEDVDWAVVALTFPQYFSPETLQEAESTLKASRPDAYTEATGRPVAEAESHALRQRAFDRRHENDWVVVSAVGDWREGVPRGYVGVWATPGGLRGHAMARTFLVPASEYDAREPEGFVVDPTRHQPW